MVIRNKKEKLLMTNPSSVCVARLTATSTMMLALLLSACADIGTQTVGDSATEASGDRLDTTAGIRTAWQTHATGAVPDDPELINAKMRVPTLGKFGARSVQATSAALPSSVDYTTRLPPPGNQGSLGSCIAWTLAYAIKTFHEVKEVGWSPESYDHQFSPRWVYNKASVHSFSESALVIASGADTLAYYPYSTTTDPTPESLERAAHFKSGSWYTIPVDSANIKTVLASGNLVAYAFNVRPDFESLNSTTNTVFDDAGCGTHPSPCVGEAHMMAIIGYDDATQRFKVMNSWGTDWGTGGFGYIPYSFIGTIGASAYVLEDASNTPGFPDSTFSSMLSSSLLW